MKSKFTEEKGVSLIVVAIILIAIVVVVVIAKTVLNQNNEKMNETVLNEVSKVALQIQKEKANLKSSLQKDVTTEDTLNYLEKLGIIDNENNIINNKVEGLKLLGNGIITYNGNKKGQVLLTDYYDKKDMENCLPQRKPDGHKGTFGHVLVIGGSKNMCGAAVFAAKAAYRMGAGLVKVLSAKENRQTILTMLPEALVDSYEEEETFAKGLAFADVIVLGPGLGTGETT